MKTKTSEFENFDRTMRDLMKVPHEDIKAALDAEKAGRSAKKSRKADTEQAGDGEVDDKR